MLSIFKSKKEEGVFNPPPELYYEFFRNLLKGFNDYNNFRGTFKYKYEVYEDFDASDSDYRPPITFLGYYTHFFNEVLCTQPNKILVYCSNVYCYAQKMKKYIDDDGDELTKEKTYWPIEMHICIVDNEIRCYILQMSNNDDNDFIERMTYQLNLEYKHSVKYRDRDRRLYIPKNQDLFVLSSFVERRDDGSYYVCPAYEIVKKMVTLCKHIIRFGEKECEIKRGNPKLDNSALPPAKAEQQQT